MRMLHIHSCNTACSSMMNLKNSILLLLHISNLMILLKIVFWVGKVDVDGAIIWSKRYVVPGGYITLAPKCNYIDIFGDLNVAFGKPIFGRW